MCSLLLKEHSFVFLFAFTVAGDVQCGSRKTSPRTSTIMQFIFHFWPSTFLRMCSLLLKECTFVFYWSFEISEYILRYQNLIIGLDSYSRQRFTYLDPILISVFESTAYLKCAKLQLVFLWLSLQSHYCVTDEAFLAETSKYGPSTFLLMCSLLLKEHSFVFLFTTLTV